MYRSRSVESVLPQTLSIPSCALPVANALALGLGTLGDQGDVLRMLAPTRRLDLLCHRTFRAPSDVAVVLRARFDSKTSQKDFPPEKGTEPTIAMEITSTRHAASALRGSMKLQNRPRAPY